MRSPARFAHRLTEIQRIVAGTEWTGIVAIGRNEGERLRACLASAVPQARHVVYVDSGSSDGSISMARAMGVDVVELDTNIPFTAARARNAGFEALDATADDLAFVQFVDGDCELDSGWGAAAQDVMRERPEAAVVCGRRSERFPGASVYNLLCDMEWDTPIGEASECGGDSLIRAMCFREVEGFRPDLIAGEEPELCARLRAAGGRVLRIDAPMTLHDARIESFSQWWMRSVRAGYANAESAARLSAENGERPGHEVSSTWFWGFALPTLILLSVFFHQFMLALLLPAIYLAQITRIALRRPKPRFSNRDQWIYALSCVLGKLPNVQGQIRYWRGRLTGRRSELIEYKQPVASDGDAQ